MKGADSKRVGASHIRELRDQLGLTQSQIGKKLGISQETFSRYEQAKAQPGYATVIKIVKLARANGINITPEYVRPE